MGFITASPVFWMVPGLHIASLAGIWGVWESHFLELLPNYSSLQKAHRQLVLLDRSLYSKEEKSEPPPHSPTEGTGGWGACFEKFQSIISSTFLSKWAIPSLFNMFLQLRGGEKEEGLWFFFSCVLLLFFSISHLNCSNDFNYGHFRSQIKLYLLNIEIFSHRRRLFLNVFSDNTVTFG